MYQRVLEAEPDDDIFHLHAETLCSPVPFSNHQIDAYRTNLMATLERYAAHPLRIDLHQIHTSDGRPPYVLMYQGRDDRPLKEQWAALFSQHPVWRDIAAPDRPRRHAKPHIGFVIARYHENVFLQYMRGIINQFPTNRFQLTIVCSCQGGEAALRPAITNPAVNYLPLSLRFDQAVEQVRQAQFDLLHYWEVGSDVNNYFLPFCRLAPVQCATWGNPVTTGIPAIDYFISSDLLETDASDTHYSETLIRLKHLPTCYARPPIPSAPKTRDYFSINETQHLYLCAQNVRKIHPDFDRLAYEILQRDPQGVLVFLEGKHEHVTAMFRQRLAQHMPDVFEQMRFLPRLHTHDYLHLVAMADVFLEPPHYNAAPMNYEALAAGTPMITLPTAFMRGRSTFALYQQMGVTDCIATSDEEYIACAVRLGTDATERAEVSTRIADANAVLFEDINAVDELADFFEYALEKVRNQ
jgi:predicted O-linked N-acetylglucosamine transferase (SPINDLY family)